MGPYKVNNQAVAYMGNKIFKPISEIRHILPPKNLSKRHLQIQKSKYWNSLIHLHHGIFEAINLFMTKEHVLLFDLPIITRMISSPGALTGTISSDVNPFGIHFFDLDMYLTQSSQLYLEFAVTVPGINKVYCWEKSFRREKADFRHLPEFTHIEYEGNHNFVENLKMIKMFISFIIDNLLTRYSKYLSYFLTKSDFKKLEALCNIKCYQQIKFHQAFDLLYQRTKSKKYKNVSVKNFGAYEELLLLDMLGNNPIFITHFTEDEVAFYHALDPQNKGLVLNADLLFPGYGELVGSGERVHSRSDTIRKATHFNLPIDDYQPYIDSRNSQTKIHSGWGMGIERFLQCIIRTPFIWDVKVFPRINGLRGP